MLKALLFDINGTLTNIWTQEESDDVYRVVSHFLIYQGVDVVPEELKHLYFEINRRMRETSRENDPEFDVVALFKEIIETHQTAFYRALPKEKRKLLPELTAQVYRGASLQRLQLYDDVRATLDTLKERYAMAAVSDGQSVWGRAELNAVGLSSYFNPVLISGDFGYRKPDKRFFQKALDALNLQPQEAIYVGNDMYRDVYGAQKAGMKTVFFLSNQGEHHFPHTKPDYVIYKFSQLINAVAHFERKEVEKTAKK